MKPPRKASLTITTTNIIGRKWGHINVKLIRIDDYFYYKRKEIENKTNEEGVLNLKSILDGAYLIQTSIKRVFSEEIHIITKDETIRIKLPSLFGWFYKKKKINENELRNIYEKFRTDIELCFKCKKNYKGYTDKFKCKYCKKYFCSDHRLPENHSCWGNPKSPSGGYRVIYSHGKTRVITK